MEIKHGLPVLELDESKRAIFTPAIEVLSKANGLSHEIPASIENSLNQLFPEQQYQDRDIQKVKEILGTIATELNDEDVKAVISEIKYLTESWLDDFEREIFGGLTLKEMLHEKGSL